MRLAGYNPEVAIDFWKKMSSSSTSSVPEIASTHPSDARRISDIQKELPSILKNYQPLAQYTTTTTTATTTTAKKATTTKKTTAKKTTSKK